MFTPRWRTGLIAAVCPVALALPLVPAATASQPTEPAQPTAAAATPTAAASNQASKPIRTPRSFTGYGFDRCVTPSSKTMDIWRRTSPFTAVGIYISGRGRACPDSAQPYLDPGWVRRQHQRGWRLLPIHVGLQAPCFQQGDPTPTKPRMSAQPRTAHRQGRVAADASVARARHFGIGKGSTLYLDIEWYNRTMQRCNTAVLTHIDAWTERLHALGYRSGLYSSASAAIQAVDLARRRNPTRFTWPNQLWFAWGNRRANLDGKPYLSDSYWRGSKRLHQYQLNVSVRHGGTAMVIDRNWLSVGKGARPAPQTGTCGRRASFPSYPVLERGHVGPRVAAARCLLRRGGWSAAPVGERFDTRTVRALVRMQRDRDLPRSGRLTKRSWVVLLSYGRRPLVKVGSDQPAVWRLQRALRAAGRTAPRTGMFGSATATAVRGYERSVGQPGNGVVDGRLWQALANGRVGGG